MKNLNVKIKNLNIIKKWGKDLGVQLALHQAKFLYNFLNKHDVPQCDWEAVVKEQIIINAN